MITRNDLLLHVQSVLPELAAQAGVTLADTAVGISAQLDAALRELSADTDNRTAGEALIEYHVLRRFRFALAARVDYQATGRQRNLSQVYDQVDDLLAEAAARASAAGHPVAAAAPGATLVRLNLDWLEPSVDEWSGL